MIFLKRFESFVQAWHTRRMSELGLELREALLNDMWRLKEHTVEHDSSGVVLWTSNGFNHFRVHDIQKQPHIPEYYWGALNVHDRLVLWGLIQQLREKAKQLPAELVLTHLRLGRIKEHGENK
jgi:hypothetical protein